MKSKTAMAASAALTLCVALGTAHADDINMNPMMEAGAAAAGPGRPTPRSIGIGLGTSVGNDIMVPNIGTARFVLSPTMIIEPSVQLDINKQSVEPAGLPTTSTSVTTLKVGAQGRFLLASRGPVDLNLLGGAMLQHTSNDQVLDSSTQAVGVHWGLGVSWFFSQWWSLSLDATNPFLTLSRSSMDTPTGLSNVMTNWTLGVVWDPSVIATVHLYL